MSTKVKVPCRISFANIWEPKSVNGSEPKYSVSCIIPKSDTKTIGEINAAIEEAKELARVKRWGGTVPTGKNFKMPLHDGDEERPNDGNYKGTYYINAISKDQPQVVDRKVKPIMDPLECTSGDYCYVSINFYGFNAGVNKGIAAGLGNIQKIKTGEHFGGRTSAAMDFTALDDENPFEDVPDFLG